ncbi:ribonucleotide reductase subunit alpha [Pseudoalteromonas sp. SSM20]|uniref:ribonucleotide reductase subunit alpha n=1 Tax=Pseudoalteromonas sp. SSM20 TaxID=3139394 RepID=UPI003BA92C76
MISKLSDLVEMANEQPDPQRLLFLFAEVSSESKKNKSQQKGTITPVMCVDKLPSDINAFDDLVKEADEIAKNWDFMFIASLSGDKGEPPTSEDAEPYLTKMTNDVMSGQNIARYVVFDRKHNPVELVAS